MMTPVDPPLALSDVTHRSGLPSQFRSPNAIDCAFARIVRSTPAANDDSLNVPGEPMLRRIVIIELPGRRNSRSSLPSPSTSDANTRVAFVRELNAA